MATNITEIYIPEKINLYVYIYIYCIENNLKLIN